MTVRHSCDVDGALAEFEQVVGAHQNDPRVQNLYITAQTRAVEFNTHGSDVACSAVEGLLTQAKQLVGATGAIQVAGASVEAEIA